MPVSAVMPSFGKGRYRVVGHLGSGASATVWLCEDRLDGSKVALKSLHPSFAVQPHARSRFAIEARAMERIRHRNVLTVFEASAEEAAPFIAMEYAPGGSLDTKILKSGPMSPHEATFAALQVCAGIKAAHAAGVVHRDIKPANVLLNRRGECKVADFGIALLHEASRLTRPGTTMGTTGFLAPEQRVDARVADARSDVYGIAATLYALLTGSVPGDLYAAKLDPTVLEGIPRPLASVIAAATTWRREDRVQSVAELARELRAAERALSDERRPPPRTERVVPEDEVLTELDLSR